MRKVCNTCNTQFNDERDLLQFGTRWRICDRGHLWFNCKCKSTLLIKQEHLGSFGPETMLQPKSRTLFEKLNNRNLIPCMSSVVQEISAKLDDQNSSSKDLADLARFEPVVAALIVSMANTMQIERQDKPITNLEHAISYTGRQQLKDVLALASIRKIELATKHFTIEDYWLHSLMTSDLANRLAHAYWTNLTPLDAYVAGGLLNIGKLISAIMFPIETDLIAQSLKAPKTAANWRVLESDHLETSHLALGELASQLWGFDESITYICGNHHKSTKILTKRATPELRDDLLDCVATANHMTHWLLGESLEVNQLILSRFSEKFALSENDFQMLLENLMTVKIRAQTMIQKTGNSVA